MAKNSKNLLDWSVAVALILGQIAIGGLFINGSTLNLFLLSYLTSPLIHQIIGYVIAVSGVLSGLTLLGFMKLFNK